MSAAWDPGQYGRFADERERPFHDLLNAVPPADVRRAVDLGCGTGNLTRLLAERWPKAQVLGLDNSPEMLEKSRENALPGRLKFERGEIAEWAPFAPYDLIVSNAALHWVPDHPTLITGLARRVGPGGIVAVQMPGNHTAPSHREIITLALTPRWEPLLGDLARGPIHVRDLADYIAWLRPLGFQVSAWETTYLQQLRGPNAVLEWIKGTFLRPYFARLDDGAREEFESEAAIRLAAAYPSEADVTLFPFRRLFFVAQRG
ncbi:MAG: methyltransferase domain-containing protein [Candidatus Eisenbacteria bacterium]|nr:methyltransferase domain-containing protein [Candidatus Eisenbacteria bacterium]